MCKNITFLQLRWRAVKIILTWCYTVFTMIVYCEGQLVSNDMRIPGVINLSLTLTKECSPGAFHTSSSSVYRNNHVLFLNVQFSEAKFNQVNTDQERCSTFPLSSSNTEKFEI